MLELFKPSQITFPDPEVTGNQSLFEVDNTLISNFVINRLVPVVGVKPYPLNELHLFASAITKIKPNLVFEWGTHRGVSARIFYETSLAFNIRMNIHTIDLPDNVSHPEHPGNKRGQLVRKLPHVFLYQGDGLDVSRGILNNSPSKKSLFFLDGDHFYKSVIRELNGIIEFAPQSSILVHDTFRLSKNSGCHNGPYRAVKDFIGNNLKKYVLIETQTGRPGLTLLFRK